MTNVNQLLEQKFKYSNSKSSVDFVLCRNATIFEDLQDITNDFIPRSNTLGMKYFQCLDIINGFSNLAQNWDSYNADKISQVSIDKAIEMLNYLYSKGFLANEITVNVFPMRDGGIQFEFDGNQICAEVEINPKGESNFILYNEEGEVINQEQIYELYEITTLLDDARYV